LVIPILRRLVPELGSWRCTEFPYIEKTHFNNWIGNSQCSYVHLRTYNDETNHVRL